MEGLLHPVGPEDARTYWIRRGAALGVLAILVIWVATMLAGLGRNDGPVAEPAAPEPVAAETPVPPAAPGTPGVAPVPSSAVVENEAVPLPSSASTAPAQPAPGEQATGQPAPPAPEPPAASPGATPALPKVPKPGDLASPTPAPLPPEPANTFHRTAPAAAGMIAVAPAAATAPAPAAATCDPKGVEVTLGGPRQVQANVPVTYRIAFTNTGPRDCLLTIDEKTFELKVYSGSDRIWSSRDCVVGMPQRGASLAPGHKLEFDLEWRANRSAPQCRVDEEPMNSGTYVATAQLADARPDQLVMQLTA